MRVSLKSVYQYPGAIDTLYELLRLRSTEYDPHVNVSHRELPPFHQHQAFVRSKPYRKWFIVLADGQVAGSLNLTKLNEIGIVLNPKFRGKGVAKAAIAKLLEHTRPLPAIPSHRIGRFLANINPKNERSIRLFTSLGFAHSMNTYRL